MRVSQPWQQKQPKNRIAENSHQNGDQTHELKPVPRGHFLAASAHGLFGQEIQSTAIAVHSRSPVGRGFELSRCQFMVSEPVKTTGPRASFGAVVLSCTKLAKNWMRVFWRSHGQNSETDSLSAGLLTMEGVW
jgi:hypothetical protein